MSIIKTITDSIPPIHREGWPFIAIFAAIALILLAFDSLKPFGWLMVVGTIWCIYFFRDPERFTPAGENLVISPADGILQKIEDGVNPPKELRLPAGKLYTRVSIFLNVFNVHVNRVPINGKITELNYHAGKFLNASLDKASEDNERQSIVMETSGGKEIIFVQIAGLIARRIVCYLHQDQEVRGGERYGIIRFGSRVDVYLPEHTPVKVRQGQTMVGGETIIAEL